jgi:hypothetical protein
MVKISDTKNSNINAGIDKLTESRQQRFSRK